MNNKIAPRLEDKLRYIDHITLSDIAEYFEGQAEIMRHKAAQNAAGDAERIAAGINYLLSAPRLVRRSLRKGYNLEQALEIAAKEMQAPISSVKASWGRFCADKSIYELNRRNTLIIELAGLGLTNAQIGKRVNLHANSVSRIISNARKSYRLGRQAGNKIDLVLHSGK